MRLIDADALMHHLADYQLQESPQWGANGYGNADKHEAITECIEAITDAPTIDAVEVRHGRWIEYPECLKYESAYCDDDIVCSVCGYKWNVIDNNTEEFDYCPHCGARMDGGQDED